MELSPANKELEASIEEFGRSALRMKKERDRLRVAIELAAAFLRDHDDRSALGVLEAQLTNDPTE